MASPVKWPHGLRTSVLKDGYQSSLPDQLLESEMERGHKLRPVATGAPEVLKYRQRLPLEELHILQAWHDGDFKFGSMRFLFPHPLTGKPKSCQVIPQDGGAFKVSPAPGNNWFVDWHIRVFAL